MITIYQVSWIVPSIATPLHPLLSTSPASRALCHVHVHGRNHGHRGLTHACCICDRDWFNLELIKIDLPFAKCVTVVLVVVHDCIKFWTVVSTFKSDSGQRLWPECNWYFPFIPVPSPTIANHSCNKISLQKCYSFYSLAVILIFRTPALRPHLLLILMKSYVIHSFL